MEPYFSDDDITIYHGDCREVLASLPECSVDSVVTDPPYDLTANKKGGSGLASVNLDSPYGRARIGTGNGPGGFMGKKWDGTGVAFDPKTWRAVLRVMKPGAYLLAFGGTRTFHRLACGIEDAGLEIRDTCMWLQGQGFPKSLDIERSIDSSLCEQVGRHYWSEASLPKGDKAQERDHVCDSTEEGRRHQGEGTALKPSYEPIILARKIPDDTVAATVLEYGTSGLNIDACRVGYQSDADRETAHDNALGPVERAKSSKPIFEGGRQTAYFADTHSPLGRWPANVLLSHGDSCILLGTKRIKPLEGYRPNPVGQQSDGQIKFNEKPVGYQKNSYTAPDGTEEIEDWQCVNECPVRMLNEQTGILKSGLMKSGTPRQMSSNPNKIVYGRYEPDTVRSDTYGDLGGASRFFYCAKASQQDRDEWLEDAELRQRDESRKEGNPGGDNPRNRGLSLRRNHHPTVKPTELMRYLVRLVTPHGGTLLDPFAGSGSTGKACALEGMKSILVEKELEYCELAVERARLRQKLLFA